MKGDIPVSDTTKKQTPPEIQDPSTVEKNIQHPKKSVLSKLRESFGKKVSKDTYDSLLEKYNHLEERHRALKADYNNLETVIDEVERLIDTADKHDSK